MKLAESLMFSPICLQEQAEMNREDKIRVIELGESATRELRELLEDRLTNVVRIDQKRIEIAQRINSSRPFRDLNSQLKDIVLGTYRENRGNLLLFLKSLREKKPWIQNLHGESSYKILKQMNRTCMEFGDEAYFGLLVDLFIMAGASRAESEKQNAERNGNSSLIVNFVKTRNNRDRIRVALQHLRNKEASGKIWKAVMELTNEEVEFLVKYENEAH